MLIFASRLSFVAAAAFGAALVLFIARRWRLAAALSSSATLVSVGILVFLIGRFFAVSSSDPSARAVALSLSFSELMNCGAIPLLVTLAGVPLWLAARRRLRAAK